MYNLTPINFKEFRGQKDLIKSLIILLQESKKIPNMIFVAPKGYGKYSLANIISQFKDRSLHPITSNNIIDEFELLNILANLKNNAILFIEDINKLKPELKKLLFDIYNSINLDKVEKICYSNKRLKIKNFSIIGTINSSNQIDSSKWEGFKIFNLKKYSLNNLNQIINYNRIKTNFKLSNSLVEYILNNCNNNPGILNEVYLKAIDYFAIKNKEMNLKQLKKLVNKTNKKYEKLN
ncbi:hypothetical protein [Mycoplasmopsis fermentans]|uniref:hypothetical protein n=1 Tax=Mycoplasmopsis fermentans TaxID=2115 RepID=UPI0001E3309A|nr:hypothetical protein [Mycoplasmopsis fermentans]ADN68890.1 hypothetical protein MFE_02830 [Mycoplasmopsis fermentans JER]